MHCSRVDAFRHRATPIIADPAAMSHARLRLNPVNPNPPAASEGVPRDEGHPPRIVPDIDMRPRGGKSGCRELFDHLGLAVALQADAGAQLPVIRQCSADQSDQRILEKAVSQRKPQ